MKSIVVRRRSGSKFFLNTKYPVHLASKRKLQKEARKMLTHNNHVRYDLQLCFRFSPEIPLRILHNYHISVRSICSRQTGRAILTRSRLESVPFRQISDPRRSRPYRWIATTTSWTIWAREADPRIKHRSRVWWQGHSTISSDNRHGSWPSDAATSYLYAGK